jgi:hypothetical protein
MGEIAFKNGDKVLICNGTKTILGEVAMTSKDSVSVLIFFDGMLGGHLGAMPIMRYDRALGIYRSIIDGTEVTLRQVAAIKREDGNGEAS